jgi:asparagine synthase (glutamine-hydrolysing)
MLLQAEDRFSMAFSIESRVPFLDAPLVAWARRLPPEAKLRRGTTKVALREAVRPLLPATVVDRPDKRGYPTPLRQWFTGAAADAVGDRLHATTVATLGLLNAPKVRAEFDAFRRGAPMPHLWRYLSLQSWGEQFLTS